MLLGRTNGPLQMTFQPWKTPRRAQLVLCVAAWIGTCGATSCSREEPPPALEPPPRAVKYVEVVAQGGSRTRTFTGFAKADVRAEFGFRVSGTVQKVYVDQGDHVEEGEVIAELDPADFKIKVREVEAALAEAKARAVLATSDFQRVQRLYEKNNVSQGEFDSALAQRESAQARVESVEQQLEQAKRQVAYTRLLATTGCGIVEVKTEEGESIQAGAAVVEVITGGKPQVEIAVPEMLIADISQGRSARVRFSAVPGRTFLGQVTTMGVVPAEGVTTYPVTIELNSSWDQLTGRSGAVPIRPGMAVEAEMEFAAAGSATSHVVPPNAVIADRQGKFVFVAESTDGDTATATKRPVETGRLVAAGLEVVSGLGDGDKVITAGLNQIKDGQPVRLLFQN